ncbi:PilN domain-containing protein [Brevibacillus sp. SYSU BS000544]|uniref:PilN domain-containing protein n=1 Tax=Brevibacillus sp. SYSU BS000544 TaxID=3416443 RepID=UPI003CE4E968
MVTINLLPQKKKKFTSTYLIYALIGTVWLAAASFLGWTYFDEKQQIETLKQSITQKDNMLATIEKRKVSSAQQSTLGEYLNLTERVQHLFYPTTLLLDELATNLPVMGKLEKVSYNLDGTITILGKFEQYDDVASYLHNLQASPYVIKAEVNKIVASPVKWMGPVDEENNPLSPALQTVGGKVLPRFGAEFNVVALTFDVKELKETLATLDGNATLGDQQNQPEDQKKK